MRLDDLRKKNKEIDAQAKARLKAGIREMENTADPVKEKQGEDYRLPRALQAGDSVLIYDLDKKAVVLGRRTAPEMCWYRRESSKPVCRSAICGC